MINKIVFPAPRRSYEAGEKFSQGLLVHYPRIDHEVLFPTPTTPEAVRATQPFYRDAGIHAKSASVADRTWGVGLLVQPRRAPPKNARRVVMYGHPNAADIGIMYDDLVTFANALECPVLAYEFWGYGLNNHAEPSEEDCNVDAWSTFYFLVHDLGYVVSDVIIMGRSIGTGPATQLAAFLGRQAPAERPTETSESADGVEVFFDGPAPAPPQQPALLLLEAPFTSIRDCTASLAAAYAPGWGAFASSMVADRFRSIDAIADVRCPTIVVHGTVDTIVPFSHGERLVKAGAAAETQRRAAAGLPDDATTPSNFHLAALKGTGHNDIPPSATLRAVYMFCPELFGPTAAESEALPLPQSPARWITSRPPNLQVALSRGLGTIGTAPRRDGLSYQLGYSIATLASALRIAWVEYQTCIDSGFHHESPGRAVTNSTSSSAGCGGVVAATPRMAFGALCAPVPAPVARAPTTSDASSARATPSSGAAPIRRWSAIEFVDRFLTLWGSPLGIYATSGGDLVWFGVRYVNPSQPRSNYFDEVWQVVAKCIDAAHGRGAHDAVGQLPTLAPRALWETPHWLRVFLATNMERTAIVALSDELESEPSPAVSIVARGKTPGIVDKALPDLQLFCERFVASLDVVDESLWVRADETLLAAGATSQHVVSPWAREHSQKRDDCVALGPLLASHLDPSLARSLVRRIEDLHDHAAMLTENGSDALEIFVPRPDARAFALHCEKLLQQQGTIAPPTAEAKALEALRQRKAERAKRPPRSSDSDCIVA